MTDVGALTDIGARTTKTSPVHPSTAARLAELAADAGDITTAARAAANPNLPADLIVGYLDADDLRRLGAAGNPACPPEELARVVGSHQDDDDGLLFVVVAENPAADDAALAAVAAARPLRWEGPVTHANAGPLTLAAVAASPAPSARLAVAVRGDTPPEILERLAGDTDPKVRAAVAANPAAPAAVRSHAGLLAD